MSPLLVFHIVAGTAALLFGFAAVFAPKRRGPHVIAGGGFVWTMAAMIVGACLIRIAQGDPAGVLAATLPFYLVVTAVRTMRRADAAFTAVDQSLMYYAALCGVVLVVQGYGIMQLPGGRTARGVPFGASFVSALVAFLAVWGDAAVWRGGPRRGAMRVRRHLWRMSVALFVASGSLFLGQVQALPSPLRPWPLRFTLAYLPLAMMLFYLMRYRRRRGAERFTPAAPSARAEQQLACADQPTPA